MWVEDWHSFWHLGCNISLFWQQLFSMFYDFAGCFLFGFTCATIGTGEFFKDQMSWVLQRSDGLGAVSLRKLPWNRKIDPCKRCFLYWKPPLSGSTLNFWGVFTKNKFLWLDKCWWAKGSDNISNKGQTAAPPIAPAAETATTTPTNQPTNHSASPLRYLHPLSYPLVRSSHLWRHLVRCRQSLGPDRSNSWNIFLELQGQAVFYGWPSIGWFQTFLYRKWLEITKHP